MTVATALSKHTPTRILHVIQTMDPEAGGPTETVRSLVLHGAPEFCSEVVTLDAPDVGFLQNSPFPIRALGPVEGDYGYAPQLRRWLEENAHRFDGVVVHGLWRYCGHVVRQVFDGKKPYVVFPHGMLDPYFKRAFPLKHIKKLVYWVLSEYWTLRDADRVLFTTGIEERDAKESFSLHRWKGMVVPLGAPEPPRDSQTLRAAFAARCPAVTGARFLLFLGRIHRKKGCDLLLDAFAQTAHAARDLHLVIAGPDQQNWATELQVRAKQAGIADRVHWPGMLSGAAKWGAFYASEAFVLPSHQENFGVAVAEALGCGRGVLLSDKVNIAQQIVSDGAGLMESDTVEGTQRLLERWLALTEAERLTIGMRARLCFDRRYDIRQNARSVLDVFGQATTPPAPVHSAEWIAQP